MIFGERSNGKTYATCNFAIEDYCKTGHQFAIIRRYREDFKGARGKQMFEGHVKNGLVKKYSKGKWEGIKYYSGAWYLSRYDEDLDKDVLDNRPFAFAFSLASMEHDKSTSFPEVYNILFDEFMTRTGYLTDEFILFMNTLSTIIRDKEPSKVKIFMCGNTVNKDCPYFREFGLKNINKMKKGDIDIYEYANSELNGEILRVAVEYADSPNKKGKPSDVFFAFNNPKLKMITGGAWELAIYPHLPMKYLPKNIIFMFFIEYLNQTMQCDVVDIGQSVFIFIHRKTTKLQKPDQDLIYSTVFDSRPNWRRHLTKPQLPVEVKICELFKAEKVFYQDNEVGEVINNYLIWSRQDSIIRA